jgi:hypothetical protein
MIDKSNKGMLVATLAVVILLLVACGSGGSAGLPGATQSTATLPQTGATSAPTSTPTTAPTAPVQPVATVPSGTITENLLLACGTNCNDPIQVTVTTIQVDDANGNMVWDVSLKDITGTNVGYGIDTFELLASGTQNQIPATISQSSGSLTNNDPYTIQATFAFVPIQNTAYTLTAVIQENPYMGPQISFEPAQITNL